MLNATQRLKLELMTNGLAVTESAEEVLTEGHSRPMTLAEYATTSGLALHLGEGIWVNAPIRGHNPNFVIQPKAILDLNGEALVVRFRGEEWPVDYVPVPAYHDRRNDSDELVSIFAATHTDRVRISPIAGCSMACSFCDLPYSFPYRRKRIDALVESVEVALRDPDAPAKHVLISGGTPKEEDYNYQRMVYRTVAERFPDVDVDIMMVPRPGLLHLEELRDWGIRGLSLNVELFDRDMASRIMPVKQKVGLDYYLDFIAEAVQVFGQGWIRSMILVGLEPLDSTLKGVEELAARGCEPVLSPFRPDPATPLRDHRPPDARFLERAYLKSREICDRYSVKLGPRCIPCQHNTLSFPDGSDYYYYSG